jgi:hypothetical protein
MKIKLTILFLVILFIVRQFYTLSNQYIKNQVWKNANGGLHMNDVIVFNSNQTALRADSIFMDNTAFAIIVKRGYRPFIPNYIVVQHIQSKEMITYHEK